MSECCPNDIPVVIASGFHLFPFRTEKLSPTAPMVLHTRGRVGRRQLFQPRLKKFKRGFFVLGLLAPLAPLALLALLVLLAPLVFPEKEAGLVALPLGGAG